jgi:hypothetical protein
MTGSATPSSAVLKGCPWIASLEALGPHSDARAGDGRWAMSRPPVLRAAFDLLPGELVVDAGRGRFRPGNTRGIATRFRRGDHRGARTEFRPGGDAHNKVPIGSVRERRETHTGLVRTWVKTAEPNVWRKRAVVVWEAAHGLLPRGHVVHHRDRNSLNDAIDNLDGLSRAAHADVHREELNAAKAAAENLRAGSRRAA